MAIKPLDRRTVLKGVLATGATVTIPLPLLQIMLNGNGTAHAQTMTPVSPLFVTWFFGNGSLPGKWKPAKTGTGTNWDLSPQLQPLAALKSYLTVISGLTNNLVVGGNEHPTGSSGATTGAGLNGNAVKLASIDQVVAGLISAGAPFKSLEVGVTPATPNGSPDSLATVSHKGPNAKNVPGVRSEGGVHPAVHGRDDHHDAGPGDEAGQRPQERARRRAGGRRDPAEEARRGRQAAGRAASAVHP